MVNVSKWFHINQVILNRHNNDLEIVNSFINISRKGCVQFVIDKSNIKYIYLKVFEK